MRDYLDFVSQGLFRPIPHAMKPGAPKQVDWGEVGPGAAQGHRFFMAVQAV